MGKDVVVEEMLGKVEAALLSTDWSRLDSLARKCRRRKYISQAMEQILIAEGELQKCFSRVEMDLAGEGSDGLEMFVWMDGHQDLSSARAALAKAQSTATDREKTMVAMLRVKMAVLEVDGDNGWEGVREALAGLDESELASAILGTTTIQLDRQDGIALSIGEAETVGSYTLDSSTIGSEGCTLDSTLPRLLALPTQYIRGLCREQFGDLYAALPDHALITAAYRDSPFDGFWGRAAVRPFLLLALYRYGILCQEMAGKRAVGGLEGDIGPQGNDMGCLRERLVHDAGVSLRLFLAAKPVGMERRRAVAMERYMEVLECRFPKGAYRASFPPDQHPSDAFIPENPSEDLLLLTTLLHHHIGHHIGKDGKTKQQVQLGISSPLHRASTRRLARMNLPGCLAAMYEGAAGEGAATAPLYGALMAAREAEGRLLEAWEAGRAYVEIGGRDPFLLLTYANLSLHHQNSPSTEDTLSILRSISDPDLKTRVAETFCKAAALSPPNPGYGDLLEEAVQMAEAALESDRDPRLSRSLALVYWQLGRIQLAEAALESSLQQDPSSPHSWHLLALLRTIPSHTPTSGHSSAALDICNMQLDLHAHPHLPTALLKTAILADQGAGEEALELLRALFAYWLGDSDSDGGDGSVAGSVEGSVGGETDMVRFRDRYLAKPTALSTTPWPNIAQTTLNTRTNETAILLWSTLAKLLLATHQNIRDAEIAARAIIHLEAGHGPEGWYRLGQVQEAQGLTALARDSYERAVAIRPSHSSAHLALARVLFASDSKADLGLAYGHATTALHSNPSDHRAMGILGQIAAAMGQPALAGKYLRQALHQESQSPLLPLNISQYI